MATSADITFMAHALRLAEHGLFTTDPNPRVGCVIVKDGEVVGEGWHCRAGEQHAEIHALQQAGDRARESDVYVTLEPCCHHGRTPPCTEDLISAGVSRVVAAMEDPNPRVAGKGLEQLRDSGIRVEAGVLQGQAEQLNPGFVQRMRTGKPWVRCKLAMSLDGRTALANGESRWISGEEARRDVQYWRARSSAVLTGIGTVLADDPAMTVRLEPPLTAGGDCGVEIRQPLRVVLDSHLQLPTSARILKQPGRTYIFSQESRDDVAAAKLEAAGASIDYVPPSSHGPGIELRIVMERLASMGINEIWVESGPTLSGALLQAEQIDELIIYVAPLLMGDGARGLFHLPQFSSLAECMRLEILDVRAVGGDWRISARVKKSQDSM
jgi:diaminohydroxyphosphoribosylaminopyrimidine deaminase / 5-amino-6-(5-phosphoribosylamino)uracil reductase